MYRSIKLSPPKKYIKIPCLTNFWAVARAGEMCARIGVMSTKLPTGLKMTHENPSHCLSLPRPSASHFNKRSGIEVGIDQPTNIDK